LIPNPPLSTNAQVGTTYSVARIMHGDVEEAPGYNSASGEVRIGDAKVGYFKILFLPKDIDAPRDSLKVQYTSRF